ncbi:DUF732 domain-containing protein [Mycobacterium paraseoulense]|uniref:DUF732 domain-containing protein n=1 Tax=Mycobacterium paraseoulense TaxID=590652 RepID=A0A1X0I9H8_9MYCO|nr:DUF732 domain-containing protein [Mycobacterium paraseoulense]MCV7394353.1 DUF732 domain-containing protein [Mycobacterium paraseoulense]ORB40241.1 hypothetical protein BST39_14205 [Mycobacterium paraseoulense]BBZ74118.1 hypothetical protein MPRS_52110 [Mycobacterium paraseoulense]
MRTLLAVVGFAAVIGAAAPAQADPAGNNGPGPDASFLAALDQAGVPFKSGPVAIGVAKKACQLMDQGHSQADVIQSMSASNPGFSVDDATKFTVSAVAAYCPQHLGEPTAEPPPGPTLPPTGMWPMFPWPTPGAA